jgi:hypothetical protein
MLRLSRAVLEKPEQKGKFWVGAKFAFLLKERTKTFSKMGTSAFLISGSGKIYFEGFALIPTFSCCLGRLLFLVSTIQLVIKVAQIVKIKIVLITKILISTF